MPPSMGLRLRQELPKDFTLRTGQDYVATEKEMKRFAKKVDVKVKNDQSDCELPWTFDEELLDETPVDMTDFNSWIPVALASLATSAMAVALAGYAWKRQVSAHSARGPLLQTEAQADPAPADPASPAPPVVWTHSKRWEKEEKKERNLELSMLFHAFATFAPPCLPKEVF